MIEPTTLGQIRQDIEHGIKSQKARLTQARSNLEFYRKNSDGCTVGMGDSQNQRQSWLMRQVVDIKTRDLYKQNPTRIIPDDTEGSSWLEQVYKHNSMWAKWPEADRLALVCEVAWFQVAATGNPQNPLRINLYGSDQIAAWSSPEDPTKPVAVCQIAENTLMEEVATTYTLWTAETILTFVGKGGEPPRYSGTEENPYKVIPFVSVHYETPTTDLWTTSPGTYLTSTNKYINWRLSEIANLIRSNPPMKVVENADVNFAPPRPFHAQDFLQVPGSGPGQTKDGKFRYEQANLSFVASEWEDLANYIEHTLECVGVPPAAYRQVQTSSRSGAALMAEQISLIEAAKGKQMPFSHYEESLAKLCFQVALSHYKGGTLKDDFSLTVKWPDLWPQMPGVERDRADQWDLDNDLQSRIGLLVKRDNLTREEAEAHLEQVAEDKKTEEALFGPDITVQQAIPTGDGSSPGDLETDQEDTTKSEEE